jgi:ATP-binding cassette, subfamily F, member 3
MPQVSLAGVSVSYGDRRLFDAVNLTVSTGSRTALVGPNGSGKTTLMRIMAGLAAPDSGSVVPEKDTRVSYVPQSGVVHGGESLRQEAERAFDRGRQILLQMAALEERLGAARPEDREAPAAAGVDSLLWKHHALQEQLEASGYHARGERIHRVLTGLGFAAADFDRPASSFSAGWQMRIALARAILEEPDILLLDEPTNYLDIEARSWLEEFLDAFPGGLLIVSHDRFFLDVVVKAVAEIYMSRVSVFSGNYSHYEEVRARELEAVMERWRAQQEEIAHVEAFIARFRYNASKARLVQSRITQLEKIERIEVPPIVKSIGFAFPPPPPSGRLVLTAEGLAKSYGDHCVFRGAGVEVSRGDKLVVVGVNGAGKSTLLRIISGREPPDEGHLTWGTGIVPAYYSQENADAWASERQVIEEVEAAAPTHLVPEVRTMLGAFLFRGDDVFKSVSVLSGGEKSRLALLMLLLRPANLLILDEPTNHLDIASKDVLLRALRSFAGTVIFVSHDRHFIENLAEAVLEVKGGGARFFPGNYEYYLRRIGQEQAAGDAQAESGTGRASAQKTASAVQRERQEDKKLKSELRSLEKEEAALVEELERLEALRRSLEDDMARPEVYANGERMRDLRRRHTETHDLHAAAMARWEELDARLGELKGTISGLRS